MDLESDAMSLGDADVDTDSKLGGGGGGVRVRGAVRRALRRRLPVLVWAARYSRTAALADAVAGLTLGLTLVPQSIAYAALADLPVHIGLYSSFVGTMLYVFLGTVKEVSIGPTSLMALLTLQTCHGLPIEFVVLLTFLSGCVVLAMGLLKLGFLVELISPAVTSGFTSATAVMIAVAQIKGLLGVNFLAESLVDNVTLLAANLHHVRAPDSALGLASAAVLLALRKVKDIPVDPKRVGLRRGLWLLSISRNALVVCAGATLAYCTAVDGQDKHPYFKLSGRVEPGLPPLGLPPMSVRIDNTTVLGFMDMARRISSGILMLPIVMVLANIAIAKSFSGGARVDATQEMMTLGICNMFGSLVHAMPTCGAFTRSAVSHASGVRTPLAGMYSGIITLLALAFMTQYFFYIPKASLSAVLICAVIFMVDTSTVRMLWGTSKAELCILTLTFAVSLCAGVELALLVGVLAALARLLHRIMRPKLHVRVLKSSLGVCCVFRPTLCCVYMNAEHVCGRVTAALGAARARLALIDCTDLSLIDHAAIQVFERLIKKMNAADQKVLFFNSSEEVLNKLGSIKGADVRTHTARTAADALRAADLCAAGDVTTPAAPTPTPTQPLLHHAPDV